MSSTCPPHDYVALADGWICNKCKDIVPPPTAQPQAPPQAGKY